MSCVMDFEKKYPEFDMLVRKFDKIQDIYTAYIFHQNNYEFQFHNTPNTMTFGKILPKMLTLGKNCL